VHAERDRRRRGRADDRCLADETKQVGDVAATRPFDVVRVDSAAGDRGDRVLELRRLVEAVGVERDRDPAGVGEREPGIDQLRVRPEVLVDLQPDRARLDERLEVRRPPIGRRPGARR